VVHAKAGAVRHKGKDRKSACGTEVTVLCHMDRTKTHSKRGDRKKGIVEEENTKDDKLRFFYMSGKRAKVCHRKMASGEFEGSKGPYKSTKGRRRVTKITEDNHMGK